MDYRELHRRALVIDGHNDTIVAHMRLGNRSFSGAAEGSRAPFPEHGIVDFLAGGARKARGRDGSVQINLAKMVEGGIDAALFSIDVTTAHNMHLAYAMDGLGFFLRDVAGARFRIARRAADVIEAKRQGDAAAILAIENADCTEGSLNVVHSLHELGVRSIGFTHHTSSVAADGCFEARSGVGLTRFGVSLVREMNRLGMLVDLAHISPSGFRHALEVTSRPVVFSHGNTAAIRDFPRNLTDEQLRALAQNRGLIGMSFVPDFVAAENPTLERLLDHIDHAVQVAGIDVVGLGSDFDGGGTLLEDATRVPEITRGLLERGYTEADVRKFLGENFLRVLGETIG